MPASLKTFGMTQVEIAEKSGLHQSHISTYLSGRHIPSLKNIVKIADACNVSIQDVSEYILKQNDKRNKGI